jgi:alkylhydroperoxidase family enzyme
MPMPRLTLVNKPSDYPGDPAEIAPLFAALFPGNPDPAFDANHAGMAVTALNPDLALKLAGLGKLLAVDTVWGQKTALRELAIQRVNLHFKSIYSFEARLGAARAAGLDDEMLTTLDEWRESNLFDHEQRLVLGYAEAVLSGHVPAEMFAEVSATFGERSAVELTSIIGLWSFWAMLLNATRPEGE